MAHVNRFPVLFDAIEETLNKKRASRLTEDALEVSMQQLLGSIRKFAPKGQTEPRAAFGQPDVRPSERLHGTSLDAALAEHDTIRHESHNDNDGVQVTSEIAVNHPSYGRGKIGIIEWLTMGTPSHGIAPRGLTKKGKTIVDRLMATGEFWDYEPEMRNSFPLLKFHWGSPLRWSGPGEPMWMTGVSHPGAEPNPFIDRAVDEQWERLNEQFDRTTDWIAFNPFRTSDVLSLASRSK